MTWSKGRTERGWGRDGEGEFEPPWRQERQEEGEGERRVWIFDRNDIYDKFPSRIDGVILSPSMSSDDVAFLQRPAVGAFCISWGSTVEWDQTSICMHPALTEPSQKIEFG